jgi:hypothetical protein
VARDEDQAWRLIAVLQSTVFLPPALAVRLYRAAISLHRTDADLENLTDPETAMGQVRSLRRELLLGTFGGPGFEANFETPTGKGFVRFIVTREGIEQAEEADARRRERERQAWN